MSDRASFLPCIPVVLLVVVAIVQTQLVRTAQLDPWKGGGFGMFSSQQASFRHTHVFVTEAGDEVEVELSDELEDLEQRLRALPSESRFRELAREVAQESAGEHPQLTAVRVELWSSRFHADDLMPTTTRLENYRYESEDVD